MLKLNRETTSQALVLLSSGFSLRKIAKKIGVSKTTLSRYAAKKGISLVAKSPGRPQKLSIRSERALVRSAESGMFKTAVEAAKYLTHENNENVSRQTVMRAFHRNGLHCYVKPLKPRLLTHHIKKRFEWARYLKDSTTRHRENIIFTYESKFNLFGPDSNLKVWRRSSKKLKPNQVRQVVKFGGGSVMVLGAITSKGVGKLRFIDGSMDSQKYVAILESAYVETVHMHQFNFSRTWILQDNDPKHTSKHTKNEMLRLGIRAIPWPSCSPDMNLIEHVWGYLDRLLRAYRPQPKNKEELKVILEKLWNSIPLDYIQALYESMPRRVNALYEAKGHHTKY